MTCFPFQTPQKALTKRKIFSLASKLYDPLGLASPVNVLAKMFFQPLWNCLTSDEPDSKTLDWDDALPSSVLSEWNSVFNELCAANTISMSRFFISSILMLRFMALAKLRQRPTQLLFILKSSLQIK